MPRFQEPHYSANRRVLQEFRRIAAEVNCNAAQLCLDTGEEPKGPPSGLQHAILRGYLIRS